MRPWELVENGSLMRHTLYIGHWHVIVSLSQGMHVSYCDGENQTGSDFIKTFTVCQIISQCKEMYIYRFCRSRSILQDICIQWRNEHSLSLGITTNINISKHGKQRVEIWSKKM